MSSCRYGSTLTIVLVCLAVVFRCPAAHGESGGSGLGGAQSLLIGAGARPTAMGGAYAGAHTGAEMIFWNPAGLAGLNGFEIFAGHTEWLDDVRFEHIALGFSAGDQWIVGVGSNYGTLGELPSFDPGGLETELDDATDFSFTLAGSRGVLGWGSMGLAVKYVTENIGDDSAHAFAIDVGVSAALPVAGLSVGGVLRNWGTDLEFNEESVSLPVVAVVGAAFRPMILPVAATADIGFPEDGESYVAAGVELDLIPFVALRGGMSSAEGAPDFTLGAGFAVAIVGIDYSYASYGDDGPVHRFSAQVGF